MLTIDPEFKNLLPPLSKEEYESLEKSILKEGCHTALIVWDGTLVDGHNRYDICQKHDISFETVEHEYASRDEAMSWIIAEQIGRRNLSVESIAYFRGKQYELEKKAPHRPQKGGKNDPLFEPQKTAEKLGTQYGVTPKTIKNDAEFAKGVDAIGKVSPVAKQKILSGETPINKKEVQAIRQEPPEIIEAVAKEIENETYTKEKRKGGRKPDPSTVLAQQVAASLYDTRDRMASYDADDLAVQIKSFVEYFIKNTTTYLEKHKAVLKTADDKQKIAAVLSEAETAAQKLKGLNL